MTPRQADKIIKAGKPVTVTNAKYGETFTAIFIKRDRTCIESADGGKFHRDHRSTSAKAGLYKKGSEGYGYSQD